MFVTNCFCMLVDSIRCSELKQVQYGSLCLFKRIFLTISASMDTDADMHIYK